MEIIATKYLNGEQYIQIKRHANLSKTLMVILNILQIPIHTHPGIKLRSAKSEEFYIYYEGFSQNDLHHGEDIKMQVIISKSRVHIIINALRTTQKKVIETIKKIPDVV